MFIIIIVAIIIWLYKKAQNLNAKLRLLFKCYYLL